MFVGVDVVVVVVVVVISVLMVVVLLVIWANVNDECEQKYHKTDCIHFHHLQVAYALLWSSPTLEQPQITCANTMRRHLHGSTHTEPSGTSGGFYLK